MAIPGAIMAAGTVASTLINKDNQQSDAQQQDIGSGIASTMQGNQQDQTTMQDTMPTGSQAPAFVKEMAQGAFQQGFNAVMAQGISGATSKSASQMGKDMRNYMAEAYPELNPWERAGASATQAGVQAAEQQNASKMLDKQLANNKQVAQIQADAQRDVADISAKASVYSADTSAAASNFAANVQQTISDNGLSQSLPLVKAQVRHVLAQAQTEEEAKSALGRIVHDAKKGAENFFGEDATDIKHSSGGSRPKGVKEGSVGDDIEKFVKGIWETGSNWISDKFKRPASNGVNSSMDDATRRQRFHDDSDYVKSLQ